MTLRASLLITLACGALLGTTALPAFAADKDKPAADAKADAKADDA